MKHEDYVSRCKSCKWVTYGIYNKFYGGCPIGCNRPMDSPKAGYQKGCGYEEKENKDGDEPV